MLPRSMIQNYDGSLGNLSYKCARINGNKGPYSGLIQTGMAPKRSVRLHW